MATAALESPTELLPLQLRTALTMEDHSLAALGELTSAARSADVKKMLAHHADETREQIDDLHKVFALLDLRDPTAPSPSMTGIRRQAESYESLIIPMLGMGMPDAVRLLQSNLDQQKHTSEELRAMLEKIAA